MKTNIKYIRLITLMSSLWITSGKAGAESDARVSAAAAPPPVQLLEVPGAKGQPRLRIQQVERALSVQVCAATCAAALVIPLPADAGELAAHALELGEGHRAARVSSKTAGGSWELVVAAPLQGAAPLVVFNGVSGLTEGEAPDRSGQKLDVVDKGKGQVDVVVGTLSEDVQLCGREVTLSPQVLYAKDLVLHRVKLQRFTDAERAAATALTATAATPGSSAPLLSGLVASSANTEPSALSDGNAATYWAEQRSGNGAGEFAVLRAPRGLPINGFDFVLRPQVTERGELTAPSQLWLVTDDKLFHVQLAGDPWLDAAATQHVALPEVIQTACVAVVLDTAFGDPKVESRRAAASTKPAQNAVKNPEVAIADILPTSSIGAAEIERAVTNLDATEELSAPALQLLQAVGASALAPLQTRYAALTAAGRMRALNVYDDATCSEAARAYVEALVAAPPSDAARDGSDSAEQDHIVRRLNQCGASVLPAGLALLPSVSKAERLELLANALADAAPSEALRGFLPLLDRASQSKRRILRKAIGHAVKHKATHPTVAAELQDAKLAPPIKLELVRALGSELPQFAPGAEQTLLQAMAAHPDYATRYRAVAPLAQLSPQAPRLRAALLAMLTHDDEPAVRAAAALLAPALKDSVPAIIQAAGELEPRVREAAITNLGGAHVESARPTLVARLSSDPWPFVRSASVRALAALPREPATTTALTHAMESDDSPSVRRPAALALGRIGAEAELRSLHDTYELDRDAGVRSAAGASLAQLCDLGQLELFTKRAVTLASLAGSEDDLLVAKASLTALGRLNPHDLKQRLAPFFKPKVAALSRRAAEEALKYPEPCRR